MNNFKTHLINAYSKLSLHDCDIFQLDWDEKNIYFFIENGFRIEAETFTEPNAMIQMKISLSSINFFISKRKRCIKGQMPKYISKYINEKQIKKIFYKKKLTIINELYYNDMFIWRGEVVGKNGYKSYGYFEINCFYEKDLEIIYCYNTKTPKP